MIDVYKIANELLFWHTSKVFVNSNFFLSVKNWLKSDASYLN